MYKFKQNAPTLGDNPNEGTLLPVQLRINDLSYAKRLRREYPERFELLRQIRQLVLEATGKKNLSELNGLSRNKEEIEKARVGILMLLEVFGEDMPLNERQALFDYYGDLADEIVEDVGKITMPGYTFELGISNKVMATSNPGKLLLMAFDESRDEVERSEAKRKLEIMIGLARCDRAVRGREKDIEYLFDRLEEQVFVPNGLKLGGTKRRWFLSTHDFGDSNRCVDAKFLDEPPQSLAKNQLLEPMRCRALKIKRSDGSEAKSYIMLHLRKKGLRKFYLKCLRYPERSPESLAGDYSGIRMIVDEAEDLEPSKQALLEGLRTPNSQNGEVDRVEIQRAKNGAGGGDHGHPALLFDKFNLVLNEKIYEFQGMTGEQYGNYQTELPYAHSIYEVLRLVRANVAEAFHPRDLYPGLPRETNVVEAAKDAYMHDLKIRRVLPKKEGRASHVTDDLTEALRIKSFPSVRGEDDRSNEF